MVPWVLCWNSKPLGIWVILTCRKVPADLKQDIKGLKHESKGAKIRNRYNQVPHLTQDTNGKVTNSQLDTTNESQEVSPFPVGDHKAHILGAIKNATEISVIFPVIISLIHFVFVLTSVSNVGERFTKTWAQLQTSAKNFDEKWQIHQNFW